MIVTIAWWNLNKSEQTIESLRHYLKNEGVDPWESIQGMRLKIWISDQDQNLWGAIMIWESAAYLKQDLPPNRAVKLIGYSPTSRYLFDVEATVEGDFYNQFLNKLGLCYEE